jgi:hypothetical protein
MVSPELPARKAAVLAPRRSGQQGTAGRVRHGHQRAIGHGAHVAPGRQLQQARLGVAEGGGGLVADGAGLLHAGHKALQVSCTPGGGGRPGGLSPRLQGAWWGGWVGAKVLASLGAAGRAPRARGTRVAAAPGGMPNAGAGEQNSSKQPLTGVGGQLRSGACSGGGHDQRCGSRVHIVPVHELAGVGCAPSAVHIRAVFRLGVQLAQPGSGPEGVIFVGGGGIGLLEILVAGPDRGRGIGKRKQLRRSLLKHKLVSIAVLVAKEGRSCRK